MRDIGNILQHTQQQTYQNLNKLMLETYWQIGKRIVQEEQNGNLRAEYNKKTLQTISSTLSEKFGKGFSVDNLANMRKLYLTYRKSETLSRISEQPFVLSWSQTVLPSKEELKKLLEK